MKDLCLRGGEGGIHGTAARGRKRARGERCLISVHCGSRGGRGACIGVGVAGVEGLGVLETLGLEGLVELDVAAVELVGIEAGEGGRLTGLGFGEELGVFGQGLEVLQMLGLGVEGGDPAGQQQAQLQRGIGVGELLQEQVLSQFQELSGAGGGVIGGLAEELVEVGGEVGVLAPAVEGGAADGEGLGDLGVALAGGEEVGGLDLEGLEERVGWG